MHCIVPLLKNISLITPKERLLSAQAPSLNYFSVQGTPRLFIMTDLPLLIQTRNAKLEENGTDDAEIMLKRVSPPIAIHPGTSKC